MDKKSIIEFNGGETTFPERIRKIKTTDDRMTPSTKFVYLALKWSKSVLSKKDNRFDPGYLFMKKRFGVSSTTYNKALDELECEGVISVKYKSYGEKKYLMIDFKDKINDLSQRIPSVIITTEVLTPHQKLFLSLLWKTMYVDGDLKTISTYHSSYKIAKELEDVGISKRSTYDRFKELSGEGGYIKIINVREDGGFSIDVNTLNAIWQYEDGLWARFKMLGGKKGDYPVYKKPKPGDFHFDGKVIIKNK